MEVVRLNVHDLVCCKERGERGPQALAMERQSSGQGTERGEHRARAGPGKASRRWWAGAAAPTVRDTGEAVGGTKAKMWMPEDLRAQRASDAAAAKLVAKQQVERLV